jgi:hypothetical protein
MLPWVRRKVLASVICVASKVVTWNLPAVRGNTHDVQRKAARLIEQGNSAQLAQSTMATVGMG